MATGPGDELEAAGRGHLRASHADREQVIGTLKTAFVQGRLTKDELDARAGQAFAARTYAELDALTADLPAVLAGTVLGGTVLGDTAPPRGAARRPMSNAARAAIFVVIAVAVPVVLSVPTGSAQLFLLFTPFYFAALAFLGAEIGHARHKRRSHPGQLPPGPATGLSGQAFPRLPSAGPGSQLPPAGRRQRHIAEGPRRLPRPALPVRGQRAGGALAAGTAPASG